MDGALYSYALLNGGFTGVSREEGERIFCPREREILRSVSIFIQISVEALIEGLVYLGPEISKYD